MSEMPKMPLKRFVSLLTIGLLSLLVLFEIVSAVSAEATIITSQQELLDAINAAVDGDVLLVGDIDFTAPAGMFNEMMRLQLSKSITIRSGLSNRKAVLTNGSFLLRGSKVSGDALRCVFENIIFDGAVDTSSLTEADWQRPYDESIQNYTSTVPLKAQYAVSFAGNVQAIFDGCEFRNYMYEYGGAMWCRYGDYTDNPYYLDQYGDFSGCTLDVTVKNCTFTGNAACYAGGAVFLDGNQDNVTFRAENCLFENNYATLNEYAQGGGAIYAQYATVELVDCRLTGNEANHDCGFSVRDGDRTRGGAIQINNGSLNMTRCVVEQNCSSLGGGLSLTNSPTTLDGCVLTQNRAANAVATKQTGPWASVGMGGAMYVETEKAIPVRLKNCSVYENSASIAYGGVYGFYNEDYAGLLSQGFGKFELFLCTVTDNTCDAQYDYSDPDLWLWYTHPGDVWSIPYVNLWGCILESENERQEMPSKENGYNYYGADGFVFEKEQTLGHLNSCQWELPSEAVAERGLDTQFEYYVGCNYHAPEELPPLPEENPPKEEQPDEEQPKDHAYVPSTSAVPTKNAKETEPKSMVPAYLCAGGVVVVFLGVIALSLRKKKTVATTSESPPQEQESAPIIVLTRYTQEQIHAVTEALPQTQRLTPRELEVFQELLMGKKQSEIAYDLGISVPTVKDNARRIYDKLEVQNKNELFIKAQSAIE